MALLTCLNSIPRHVWLTKNQGGLPLSKLINFITLYVTEMKPQQAMSSYCNSMRMALQV